MPQSRVYLPENPVSETLRECGFRWCQKDRRFEKPGRLSPLQVLSLKKDLPVGTRITYYDGTTEVLIEEPEQDWSLFEE